MQLDVEESMHASFIDLNGPSASCGSTYRATILNQDMNYCLVNNGPVTGRQMDREKVMHKSPPCSRTDGLRKAGILNKFPMHYTVKKSNLMCIPSFP